MGFFEWLFGFGGCRVCGGATRYNGKAQDGGRWYQCTNCKCGWSIGMDMNGGGDLTFDVDEQGAILSHRETKERYKKSKR